MKSFTRPRQVKVGIFSLALIISLLLFLENPGDLRNLVEVLGWLAAIIGVLFIGRADG